MVLTADHMPGMKGATATIASSTDQTVYVVDYTAGGMTMKNHKWVVQDEMKPAK
ncbi:YdhK family protein [Raoultella sp. 18093]|uniref:YdhK family protein n=1 Tax=Raoultella sp. 18093 TaxID=2681425 RepID=UPI001D115862|nr:YdhK family protein [Raoultella sp. 18093]